MNELGEFGRKNTGYYNIPAATGKFFYNLVLISKAKNILEIGTSNGYSTIWLAEAAKQNKSKVTTIEISESKVNMAMENFKRANLSKIIKIIHGDALEEIPKLREEYDFMFIDAIKKDYITYLRLAEKNLKKNAAIVADNAIMFKDKMQNYLNYLQNNKKYSSVLVPIGTGVEFSIKIK
ncbi:O-methyltransferase [Candidatus Woesearchaeota archaeon]|nr:O-methyltransferase [Candidatus Woesearchaeota archaeon]